jgi:hypothetical protein
MKEGANLTCDECNGEGEVWLYWVNHKERRLCTDLAYCHLCFQQSFCSFEQDEWFDWMRIEPTDAFEFEKNGYTFLEAW